MDFEQVLFSRRSVRRFDPAREVSQEQLRRIVEAGIHAPSACNFQAWKFLILQDPDSRRKLKSQLILQAPCAILVLYRNDLLVSGRKHRDYVQSGAAAIENMLLEAENLGLGGCWVCDLPRQGAMRRAFSIPRNFDVIACVLLGVPAQEENTPEQQIYHYGDEESARRRTRKYGFEQVVCQESFRACAGGGCETERLPWAGKVLLALGLNKRRKKPQS